MKKKTQQKFDFLISYFEEKMPVAEPELQYRNSYELLVAVVLSAQCTDKRVNMVTPALFQRYPSPFELAKASVEDIYELIKSVSYPNSKAKHLKGLAEALVEHFNGVVPDNMEDLQTLPGVGRKTANVILAVIFDQPAFAVDTHVFRVANRTGLANASTPEAVEQQLLPKVPPAYRHDAHHLLLLLGRYICKARRPECGNCPVTKWCRGFQTQEKDK